MPNREDWYYKALNRLRDWFGGHGYSLPAIRIGCGWPTRNRKKTNGECWSEKSSADRTHEIFISPMVEKSIEILAVLVHELCHTIAGVEAKHKKPFIEVARNLGLEGPWTQSQAGEELAAYLEQLSEKLGPYPHSKMTPKDRKKTGAGSRLLKVQCPACDYIARVTRKHLIEKGAPICPVHNKPFKEVPPR